MEIITLYESGSTDGYTTSGNGKFYLSEGQASVASSKNGGYGRVIIHNTIAKIDGKYYKLAKIQPIILADSEEEKEWLKKIALSKLTKAEREILGLP